jgi:hypothetical protein
MMATVIILVFVFAVLLWLFFSPVSVSIDTTVPEAKFTWKGIGKAILIYKEDEWLLFIRVLFFKTEKNLSAPKLDEKKKRERKKTVHKKKRDIRKLLKKGLRVVKSFAVTEWRISVDTGDHVHNAWLYPLNFIIPGNHCNINFHDENYLVLQMKNKLWRMLYAWLR